MDINKLEKYADTLFNNISGWETDSLIRIAKRIKLIGEMSPADVDLINNSNLAKQDFDAIMKELAKLTKQNISDIEKMYSDVFLEYHLDNQSLYDYRKIKFIPFAENAELQAIIKAYVKTSAETMINISKTKSLCVIDSLGNTTRVQEAIYNAFSKATMSVATGTTDFNSAMRDTISELGGSGMRVKYGDITRRLDSVVRQNLLWGAKQASIEYAEYIKNELGCDGYEIDWHNNPRPSHEFMQGKQYSAEGEKTINGVVYKDAYEQGVLGENGALNDYGCLHFATPIICGVSEPVYSDAELKRMDAQNKKTYKISDKEVTGYEAKQMMRKLETAIRKQKTIKVTAAAGGMNTQANDCDVKINALQKKYDEICDITGFKPETNRLTIVRKKS